MIAVSFEDLGHRFSRNWLFRHLNGHFQTGDFVLVTGRNGAGKSTLLRMTGLLADSLEGKVHLSPSGQYTKLNRHLWCGYVSPPVRLYAELTGEETLRLAADSRQLTPDARLDSWKASSGLSASDWNKPVRQWSSGMTQRLKLLTACMHAPHLLLLDEPFSNLDQSGRNWFESILADMRSSTLIFLATNDPADFELSSTVIRIGDEKA
ncbi:MAG: ATP-binding cassette domain-containing protein [Bacteroidetes bacterium]|nr:ATP-binding cassette domain-containing protein [Bacteroidota bacterium]